MRHRAGMDNQAPLLTLHWMDADPIHKPLLQRNISLPFKAKANLLLLMVDDNCIICPGFFPTLAEVQSRGNGR